MKAAVSDMFYVARIGDWLVWCYRAGVFRVLLMTSVLALAPFQCRGSDDPASARSESPGDALYQLAQEFRSQGNEVAYRQTLQYLIDRYPSSRRAVTAKSELKNSSSVPSAK